MNSGQHARSEWNERHEYRSSEIRPGYRDNIASGSKITRAAPPPARNSIDVFIEIIRRAMSYDDESLH